MPPMLDELSRHPECGLLGWEALRSGLRTFLFLQYWRDFEGLDTYANDARFAHLPAWKAFNRAAKAGAAVVGVFHETYVVPAGCHETINVDMPLFGLPKAAGTRPATGSRQIARERLKAG
jgi:hypothetical protein